jgi:hypothetical protein
MSIGYNVRRVTVDSVSWTAIVVPDGVACSRVTIENADYATQLAVRTDSSDSTTETQVYPGAMKTIPGMNHFGGQFLPGTVVCYVKAASGTGPVVVEFIR